MPHFIVKLYPGKSDNQKQALADAITQNVVNILGGTEQSVSVAFEEVDAKDWKTAVYDQDIAPKLTSLAKKPGYDM